MNTKLLLSACSILLAVIPAHAGYVHNDPINMVDPTGMCGADHDNTDVCVYGIPGAGPSDNAGNSALNDLVDEHGGVFEDIGVRAAENSIRAYAEANPDAKIIITGYSRGGNEAVELANNLGKGDDSLTVDSLVTFDPHRNFGGNFKLTEGNVTSATNFFQQNPTTKTFGFPTGTNPYNGRAVDGATNFDLTGHQAFGYAEGQGYVHNGLVRMLRINPDHNRVINDAFK